jgi:hypothetical protein
MRTDADVRLDLVRDSVRRIASATMSPSPSPARMQACRITAHRPLLKGLSHEMDLAFDDMHGQF